MPRIPEGSWPPTERVRPVIVTELDNLLGFPYTTAPAVYPIVPADSVVSPVFDVLTPLYQGRGENETPTLANDEGWTRGLGIPGVNVSVEFRSASYVLDASIWFGADAPKAKPDKARLGESTSEKIEPSVRKPFRLPSGKASSLGVPPFES